MGEAVYCRRNKNRKKPAKEHEEHVIEPLKEKAKDHYALGEPLRSGTNPGRLTADGTGSNDGKPCAKLDTPQVR
jgi:hypothetical protein